MKKDKTIQDIRGRAMAMLTVVTETIKYLKQQLIEDIRQRMDRFDEGEILYVLTVPAIWSDSARAFMRDAAEAVCSLQNWQR